MLEELIGGGLGLVSGILNGNAAKSRFKKMMRHLREVEAYQRNKIAEATGAIQGAKQAWQQNPNRAKAAASWQSLLDNPSAYTPELVSSVKQNAASGFAKDTAELGNRAAADAQRRGLGNSPLAAQMQSTIYGNASRDLQNLVSGIDTEAAKQRLSDKKSALAGYTQWQQEDAATEYGFSRDLANLLGGINYGSSLAMTGA